jgi:iron complex outermembrane receptor protein
MIDWVRKNDTEKWQTLNMTTIKSSGIEMSGIVFPEHILNKQIWLSKLSFNYSFNELNKGVNEFDSYYVLDNLKHKIDIELIHKIYKPLNSSWSASYQDRNGMRTSSEDYQPFWLLNWKLSWRMSLTEIYIMASNLLGTVYFDYGTVEQPGRWISAGVNHRINYK